MSLHHNSMWVIRKKKCVNLGLISLSLHMVAIDSSFESYKGVGAHHCKYSHLRGAKEL